MFISAYFRQLNNKDVYLRRIALEPGLQVLQALVKHSRTPVNTQNTTQCETGPGPGLTAVNNPHIGVCILATHSNAHLHAVSICMPLCAVSCERIQTHTIKCMLSADMDAAHPSKNSTI